MTNNGLKQTKGIAAPVVREVQQAFESALTYVFGPQVALIHEKTAQQRGIAITSGVPNCQT
ncbi:hypothetical protein CVV65_05615 [Kyrpidia spormannii]|uniref:Uncharacterized protein n=1 Tax=Kyrpidia spormannii TaxID=2055160 RepID=A0A2K8N594_9BACL|nr:hypothetical protein CVV65_05615 [Kyrpidia spormannii]